MILTPELVIGFERDQRAHGTVTALANVFKRETAETRVATGRPFSYTPRARAVPLPKKVKRTP